MVVLLQKARFLTNLTVASREKETGLLTALTFFSMESMVVLWEFRELTSDVRATRVEQPQGLPVRKS